MELEGSPPHVRRTILLVEDTDLHLAMQKAVLGRDSFDLVTAKTGAEGLEKARAHKPDLILLDLNLPDLKGDEVALELKASPHTARVPVLIVTAEREGEALHNCVEAGCDGFLFKPFTPAQLLEAVHGILVAVNRRHKRLVVDIPCSLVLEDDEYPTVIRTLSAGGAFLEMAIQPRKGDLFDMVFRLPGVEGPVKAEVVVRWASNFLRGKGKQGIGVQFSRISREDLDRVQAFVEREIIIQTKKNLPK